MIKKYETFIQKANQPEQMLETIQNPNFSIVVPGGCNGNCDFCFWHQEKTNEGYINGLKETMKGLPSQFYQLSLTGGEPTLSPMLDDILEAIDTDKFKHVVLTTNGTNLKKHIPKLKGKVQHVNISRHHYRDDINEEVFKTHTVPKNEELKELTKLLQDEGIDVTYSAVLTEHLDNKEEIKKYLKYAKSHNVFKVFFRKPHGTLDPSPGEKAFEHLESETHQCPVCRNTKQNINESAVVWKASLEEPSKELGMIYELVYNQDGVLSSDWDKEHIVDYHKIKENKKMDVTLYESCGGSSYSGCGGYSDGSVTGCGATTSYSSCGSDHLYVGCGAGEPELTDAEKKEIERQERLRKRHTKVEKVIKTVRKQLADDYRKSEESEEEQ